MQIRAAQADRGHLQRAPRPGARGHRLGADADVAGAVEAGNLGAIVVGHVCRWP
jgi:hypothetical protein